ncbi:cation:proton antiporter [Bdellovibrio sp. SKB1291214]|uniref:cation:proton antiporter domain-containing protein n=1 Tax=Bdellovibrio sp. SKB1291214 TaxID=1732569 RepID=UPI000B514DDB|nr:cation:proton antiporter [Bdellovibrio sp. SKB1291214]UYL07406.1 cation:proton antiporter [Bdellovibrio sp. SKB1291214]
MEHLPAFLTLVIVISVARFFGMIFRKLGQPSVMGEVLGGIVLGPSVIGYFFPGFTETVFHPESMVFLKHVAEIGITFYLFVMGLEIDLPRLRHSAKSAVLISQVSILFPFALGLLLAWQIFDQYAPAGIGHLEFSLFIGVSLSITAFPVLARILADSRFHKTSLGDLALTCAAIDDITAWCLVAVVTGLLKSSMGGAGLTIVLTAAYVLVMLFVVRPLIGKIIPRIEKSAERLPQAALAIVVLGALGSATITHLIGIHAFFGAFLFGAVIPHNSLIAKDVTDRLQDFVAILFLPAFFALTGVKTQVGLLASGEHWVLCLIIISLAILGKFGGAFAAAKISGNSTKDSTILGLLMNTRGLVELIVLNIGLSVGVLTPTLFTMLVIMALVTTFMTGPLLKWVDSKPTVGSSF